MNWVRILSIALILNCAGCRLITQTIGLVVNLALQLLPFFLFVSIDDDLDGTPETTESYAIWVDPVTETTEVRGSAKGTTGLQVHRAWYTSQGWAMDVSFDDGPQHLNILVPRSGHLTTQVDSKLTLTARPSQGWSRNVATPRAL